MCEKLYVRSEGVRKEDCGKRGRGRALRSWEISAGSDDATAVRTIRRERVRNLHAKSHCSAPIIRRPSSFRVFADTPPSIIPPLPPPRLPPIPTCWLDDAVRACTQSVRRKSHAPARPRPSVCSAMRTDVPGCDKNHHSRTASTAIDEPTAQKMPCEERQHAKHTKLQM